jgi:hypothetical protein
VPAASPTTSNFTGRPSNVALAAVRAPARKGTWRRTQSLFRQLVNGPRDSQRHQPILQLGVVHGQSDKSHEGPRSAANFGGRVFTHDLLGYAFMSLGMCRRLGNSSRPSTALLSRHIHAMNDHFNQLYREATTNRQRREICRAALVNLAAWLGWLRAGETFSSRWEDVTMTEPRDGAAWLRLLEQTKSDRTQTADVVPAYTSASGLSIGLWYQHRLRRACGGSPPPTEHVFQLEEGAIPTSTQSAQTPHLF